MHICLLEHQATFWTKTNLHVILVGEMPYYSSPMASR